jgi:protein phosphatase
MYIEMAAKTDRGRVRDRNEDNFLVVEFDQTCSVRNASIESVAGQSVHHEAMMILVADGMGGQAEGDLASRIIVEHFAKFAKSRASTILASADANEEMRELLCGELELCHTALKREAEANAELRGMGSTATVAVVAWPTLYVAHVGDSRCYLFRDGRLRQLTRDHSVAQLYVDQGYMNASEVSTSEFRHRLWNVIGGNVEEIVVDFHEFDLQEHDALLLCTDGLTNRLTDVELADELRSSGATSEICDSMVAAANAAGGKDNITCALTRFAADKSVSSAVCNFETLPCGIQGLPAPGIP